MIVELALDRLSNTGLVHQFLRDSEAEKIECCFTLDRIRLARFHVGESDERLFLRVQRKLEMSVRWFTFAIDRAEKVWSKPFDSGDRSSDRFGILAVRLAVILHLTI